MYRHVCIYLEVRGQPWGTGFVLPSPQACIASALTWGTQCCSTVSFIYLLTCVCVHACMHACVYVWQSHYVGQADLELRDQSASTSFVLGLKMCLTLSRLVQACLSFQMPSFNLYFYFTLTWPEVLFCSRSGASWLPQSGLCEGCWGYRQHCGDPSPSSHCHQECWCKHKCTGRPGTDPHLFKHSLSQPNCQLFHWLHIIFYKLHFTWFRGESIRSLKKVFSLKKSLFFPA